MIGSQIAAILSRKSWAYVEVAPGKGFMNVIRVFGCRRLALIRSIPMGILYVASSGFQNKSKYCHVSKHQLPKIPFGKNLKEKTQRALT